MTHAEDASKTDKSVIESYCGERLDDPFGQSGAPVPHTQPIDADNPRIVHGTMEIANQMHTMAQGLKQLGVTAHVLNYYSTYLKYKSDLLVNIKAVKNVAVKDLASKIIPRYDVFHFHFGTSLTPDYSDLLLLRDLNKKVLMHHWGSDVRLYSQAVKNNPYVKVKVFIGTKLCTALHEDNSVLIYDNFKRNSIRWSNLLNSCNVRPTHGDVLDSECLRDTIGSFKPDIVVYLAAVAGIDTVIKNPADTMRVNMIGAYDLLEALRENIEYIERYVNISTSEVFGSYAFKADEACTTNLQPVEEARWTYSVSKLAGEHLTHSYYKWELADGLTQTVGWYRKVLQHG